MIWNETPDVDGAPADLLIGQPDFTREGRNAAGFIAADTLNVPTGIAYGNGVLAVADAWNHRVLLWQGFPTRSNTPADIVVGQADFHSGNANRGLPQPGADTLNWCYGVLIHDDRLVVADTGNRRVLVWDRIPSVHGQPADLVLGQADFLTRDDSIDRYGGAAGMRWPHGVAASGNGLFVADAGLNRVMVWNTLPRYDGAPCDAVLGQMEFTARDHNRGGYHPTAATLNMPYGMAVKDGLVVVADTANSRLVGFDATVIESGRAAVRLAGQMDFDRKGDNRWAAVMRDSLCWPYAVSGSDGTFVIADSGNNRVLLWDAVDIARHTASNERSGRTCHA